VETLSGAIITLESGTDARRRHRHNGYSSGFSPASDQCRDHGWQTRPTGTAWVITTAASSTATAAAAWTTTRTVAGKSDVGQ
jgi:hypothetical protein